MEMVSAVKMRKAQQRVTASRPYSDQLRQIMSDLATQQPDPEQLALFPLLQKRPIRNIELIAVTPDRGLTGALNANILRAAPALCWMRPARRCRSSPPAKRRATTSCAPGRTSSRSSSVSGTTSRLDAVRAHRRHRHRRFRLGKVDAVYVVYSKFVNTLMQRPEVVQILPVEPPARP